MKTLTKELLAKFDQLDPKLVAEALGENESDCWQYLDELNTNLSRYEAKRREDQNTLKEQINSWVESIPDTMEIKKKAILEQLAYAKYFPERYDIKKLEREAKRFLGDDTITDYDIQRAKEYPIAQLLNTQGKRGNVSCPFHEDKTPSLSIKGNRFKCFSCQESGDVIDLYKKIHNVNFIEAVKSLK